MRLVSENVGGNLHDAVRYINKVGLADYVIHMDYNAGNTVVVFRLPVRHPLVVDADLRAKRAEAFATEFRRIGKRPADDAVLADRGYTQDELDRTNPTGDT